MFQRTHKDIYELSESRIIKSTLCLLQDYNNHIEEISNKLVSIMDNMMEPLLSKVIYYVYVLCMINSLGDLPTLIHYSYH